MFVILRDDNKKAGMRELQQYQLIKQGIKRYGMPINRAFIALRPRFLQLQHLRLRLRC